MHLRILKILVCPQCRQREFKLEKFEYIDVEVVEGRLICLKCKIWFRIQNGILDFLPLNLRRSDSYLKFSNKYKIVYKLLEVDTRDNEGKSSQIDFFKKDVFDYEKTVVNNKYYKALDNVTIERWIKKNLSEAGKVLELGCGTARQSIPLAKIGIKTIAIDISEEMLLLGRKKVIKSKLQDYIDFVIADCEDPPFVNNYFNACIFYGTLHHIPKPQLALFNAAKKLRSGGLMYTSDPNKSGLRFIFDLAMGLWPLYEENTGEGELIGENKLGKWLKRAGLMSEISFSTFMLPHFFIFSFEMNQWILALSDRLFAKIPLIRSLGGIIIAQGVKK